MPDGGSVNLNHLQTLVDVSRCFGLALALTLLQVTAIAGVTDPSTSRAVVTRAPVRPLTFDINAGQADRPAEFVARGRGYAMMLSATQTVFALRNPIPPPANRENAV